MSEVGSVLVIRLSALGDVLFAMPAVQSLIRSGIASRVSWLVEDRAATLVHHVEGLSEVIVFPRRRKLSWPAHAATLRRRSYDVVLDLQTNTKSRVQRSLVRAPRTVGFDAPLAKEGAQRGLSVAVQPPATARHKITANLHLVAALGLPLPEVVSRPVLPVDTGARTRVTESVAGARGSGPLVVFQPGTSAFGRLKRWAPERFAQVADGLVASHDARVVVSAGPGEEALAEAMAAATHHPLVVLPPAGQEALLALMDAADLVVASDSYPLHLANALGTGVVGLYGPKDPAITGPFFDRADVVRSPVACSPCTLRRCRDRICMERLAVDPVLSACRRRLGPTP